MKAARALLPAAVLVTLPLVLYAPFLFAGRVLYWAVYLLQFYPWRQLAVEQIRAGHWPLWNPYLGAGTPLAANLQTAAFYPLNVLFLLMPVERAFAWELALHVALAGLSAYYLGRSLGLSRFGSLVGGLVYGGGGYIVAHWVFPSMVYAAAWLPLLLGLTEQLLRGALNPKPTGKAVSLVSHSIVLSALLALAIALQLLAGHAQTSFYSGLIVAAFAVSRLAFHALRLPPGVSRPGPYVLRALWALALAGLWGVALAAIQLLPTAEFVAHSQRPGTLTDLTLAHELSFWPWRLVTLLAPDLFGHPARNAYWAFGTYWEEAAYVGILSLLLAAVAVVAWWRTRKEGGDTPLSAVPFFCFLCFISLLLALGNHTPIYPLLFRFVPGFGLFQAPARLMIGYALGMAVLAGIGAEVLRLTPRTRTALRLIVVAGLGIGVAGIVARLALPAVRPSFGESMIRLGLTLALAGGVLLLQGHPLRRTRWQALVVALVVADLLAFGWGLAPGTDPSVYHAPVKTAEFLQDQPPGRLFVLEPYAQEIYDQYVSLSTFGTADPAHLQGLRESLIPNLNTVHHLAAVGNYDPLTVGLYHDLYAILEGEPDAPPDLDDIRPVLNLFGARYLLTTEGLGLPEIYGNGPRIYDNESALPAAFVVHRASVIENKAARLAVLLDPAFDPLSEVILNRPPSLPFRPSNHDSENEQPTILHKGPDQVIIGINMVQPGYLVLADTHYPGWRATVDGTPVEILPADHAFRAVVLDQGEHRLVFEYAPLSFRVGAWISLGAAVVLVALLGLWIRDRR